MLIKSESRLLGDISAHACAWARPVNERSTNRHSEAIPIIVYSELPGGGILLSALHL